MRLIRVILYSFNVVIHFILQIFRPPIAITASKFLVYGNLECGTAANPFNGSLSLEITQGKFNLQIALVSDFDLTLYFRKCEHTYPTRRRQVCSSFQWRKISVARKESDHLDQFGCPCKNRRRDHPSLWNPWMGGQ